MQAQANPVVDAAERIFADLADPQSILKQPDAGWRARLWRALEDAGLPAAWAPESLGGHGLSLAEGFALVRAAGRAALAVPLVETLIAGRMLGLAGLALPPGAIAVVPAGPRDLVAIDDAGRVGVRARRVPFASGAGHLVVVCDAGRGARVALLEAGRCTIAPGRSLADDPSDGVEAHGAAAVAWAATDRTERDALLALGATARALQIAGALERMLEMTVRYAQERVAFEKPIAKFQAVQHHLARLAGEAAAALAVAESAADAMASGDADPEALLLEVASAKVRCGEAAEAGAAIAHQVHGAIGISSEHALHRYTMRALAWRDEFGDESHWARRLGGLVATGSGESLWHRLAAR